jgi:small subunit ribosomal protein S6
MRKYELMIIIDPETDDRQVPGMVDQYAKVITDDGGTVENIDIWGRRRLAYEIDKKTEGIYALVDINAEPSTVQELDRQLGISEQVMRRKVMRADAQ